jgi:spermidine/putrescine transport system substrate-binding protein
MVALYAQGEPGTYDVVMSDPENLTRLREANGLEPLDPAEFPASESDNFDHYKPSGDFPFIAGWQEDKWYAAPWDFAYQSMSYNSTKITAEEASSYAIVWDPKAENRVSWSTYWLNCMSVISQYVGATEGYWEPFQYAPNTLTDSQFATLRDFLLSSPKTARGFYGIGDATQAMATEEIWLTPGSGWTTNGVLTFEGLPIVDIVPQEGAVMYTESLSLATGAKNVEGAKAFINYCISPEGSARKGILPAYQGVPCSEAAWQWIADNEPEWVPVMRIDLNGPNVLDDWNKGIIAVRVLPENIEEWVNTYEEFKNYVSS